MSDNPAPQAIPPFGTLAACYLHTYHKPHVTYTELHHTIPREWQSVFTPPTFSQRVDAQWPNAKLVEGQWLWDARTMPICRTGHGNVHFYLVKLTHWMYECHPDAKPTEQLSYARTLLRHTFTEIDMHAAGAAYTGIIRFAEVAGSLKNLFVAKAWGQI
jgi:hypothetical protein